MRMGWNTPPWAWLLYRSGCSHKDARQKTTLVPTIKKAIYLDLLRAAIVAMSHMLIERRKGKFDTHQSAKGS
jgi:uncharacterized metal-binding protein